MPLPDMEDMVGMEGFLFLPHLCLPHLSENKALAVTLPQEAVREAPSLPLTSVAGC